MAEDPQSASALIDAKIERLTDWRGATLAMLRDWIRRADPGIVEEVKWRKPTNPDGVPVWSCEGLICTGEVYRDKVKLTFAYGAALDDPAGLFNASLDGGTRRAIDIHHGAAIDGAGLTRLVAAAVAFNRSKPKARR